MSIDTGTQTRHMTYDSCTNGIGRVCSVSDAAGTTSYTYDPQGDITRREFTVGSTTYALGYSYDSSGRLAALTYPDGNYVWLGGRLVGRLAGGQVDAVHTDQVGRPEAVTNASGAIVWQSLNFPFVRAVSKEGITLNIGFPRQYYDAETGLWHNGYRDYAPTLGRYIESDPIGLKGGLNTYAYVMNNPIKTYDIYGLQSVEDNIQMGLQPLNPGYPLTYDEYTDQCKSRRALASQERKNQALLGCLAKKFGIEVAGDIAADMTVAGASELLGPEYGLPVTIGYVYLKGSKAMKIYKSIDGVKNIVSCVLKTQ